MTSILTYSPPGATSVPASVKKDAGTTGWTEVGIVSTPVIDPATGTLYLVAETYENGNVVHRLHALDVTTGLEKLGGPTTIAASYTLNGSTTIFADLYQLNRPGLLLANGHIYIGFGSNCCNEYSQGWILSYNAATLQQEGSLYCGTRQNSRLDMAKRGWHFRRQQWEYLCRNGRRLLFGRHEPVEQRGEAQPGWQRLSLLDGLVHSIQSAIPLSA